MVYTTYKNCDDRRIVYYCFKHISHSKNLKQQHNKRNIYLESWLIMELIPKWPKKIQVSEILSFTHIYIYIDIWYIYTHIILWMEEILHRLVWKKPYN